MKFQESILDKNEYFSKEISKNLYLGACVRIKNSEKTYQVVGINQKTKVCWIREWPFDMELSKTFALEINQIILQTICSNQIRGYLIS